MSTTMNNNKAESTTTNNHKAERPTCRWGILGCANIAVKACRAITTGGNGRVVAVASRSVSKAEHFIKNRIGLSCEQERGMPRDGVSSCEPVKICSYDELVEHPDIDAIYIPLPTKLHLEWVTKCAKAKKHVLVEKPVALNATELASMLTVCIENNVLFMDGVMFVHHDRLKRLEDMFTKDPLQLMGSVERITSSFTFNADHSFWDAEVDSPPGTEGENRDIRLRSDGDTLGCLGDLGWYCIRIALVAFQSIKVPTTAHQSFRLPGELPTAVTTRLSRTSLDGNPVDMSGEVYFGSNASRMLSFHCSFVHTHRQWVEIVTSKKIISMDDFVNPSSTSEAKFVIRHFPESGSPGIDLETHFVASDEEIRVQNCSQERNQFEHFSQLVIDGLSSNNEVQHRVWMAHSWFTQVVVDHLMNSANQNGERVEIPYSCFVKQWTKGFLPVV